MRSRLILDMWVLWVLRQVNGKRRRAVRVIRFDGWRREERATGKRAEDQSQEWRWAQQETGHKKRSVRGRRRKIERT